MPVFPLTCAWSVLPDHTMPASFMATQDIKFVVLNARLKYNLYKHNLSQFALFNLLP